MPHKKTTAYLITGGRFHAMDFARLELLKLLGEQHHIRTKTGNDYRDIEGIAAADFLITYTCDLLPTPAQAAALRGYIANGGKWFALHGTNSVLRITDEGGCKCPDDAAPDFFELLGTQFKAHPPIGPYRVDITDPSHPLTQGLESFETVDEQYLSKPRADIHMLLETRFVGEATGFVDDLHWVDDRPQPVLYLRKFGKGEILYLTLGHCRGHYDLQPLADFNPIIERCSWNLPVYYELLRRGINWAQEPT
jgi:hypothetical protein